MRKLVVLSGAGISEESGIRTFRDMGGFWEEYDVEEVCTPQAWEKNPELVMRFYNDRRRQLYACTPNKGHLGLAELEKHFDVEIITQNIDDLHEQAGSSKVLHLHGELKKARSSVDPSLIYDMEGWELKFGQKCEKGSQLRPHVVWFGEPVPAIENAMHIVEQANVFVIVGTSMNVYPAAGLLNYVKPGVPVFCIDPNPVHLYSNITFIKEKAGIGVEKLISLLK
ncbi:MAG: NAD-dependent deacylase, partial [Prolixibacteraceae bacterium]|nr:NAD-dependent deacylase [Prolixibacteraceae bacterium]